MGQSFRPAWGVYYVSAVMIILPLLLAGIFFIAWLVDPQIPWDIFVPWLLLVLPMLAAGVFLLWRYGYTLVLTDLALEWRRFGRLRRRLAYETIQHWSAHDSQLFPYLRLETTCGRFVITSQLKQFDHFLAQLTAHCPPEQPAQQVALPLRLAVPRRDWLVFGAGISFLYLFLMAISWPLARANNDSMIPLAVVMGLLCLFIGLVALALEMTTPVAVRLTGEEITWWAWFGWRWKRPVSAISALHREKYVMSYRGFSRTEYPVVILFADGKKLRILEKRCWSFGYAPSLLLALLQTLYPAEIPANGI